MDVVVKVLKLCLSLLPNDKQDQRPQQHGDGGHGNAGQSSTPQQLQPSYPPQHPPSHAGGHSSGASQHHQPHKYQGRLVRIYFLVLVLVRGVAETK